MNSTGEARFQAVKGELIKYMEGFTSEFKLRPSAFMDFDAEWLTKKVLDAVDEAEAIQQKEADLETHATEKYDTSN